LKGAEMALQLKYDSRVDLSFWEFGSYCGVLALYALVPVFLTRSYAPTIDTSWLLCLVWGYVKVYSIEMLRLAPLVLGISWAACWIIQLTWNIATQPDTG